MIEKEKAKAYDKKIREAILNGLIDCRDAPDLGWSNFGGIHIDDCIDWLEKKGEQKPCMIQWKGDNLKEVIGFTGKDKNFGKWFKSFEEYEKYVHEHNDIFKLFNENGSHYEIPVGAWIVKTPDGYNIASNAVLKQKSINERAWLYLVSDVLTWKDGIGQYLDDPRVQELAKRLCSEYAQKLYNPSVLSNSSNTYD